MTIQDQSASVPAVFSFEANRTLRVVDQAGEPWFVAADVCGVLGIEYHRDALAKLDDDERGSVKVDTLGGTQQLAAVSESGLYTLILRCRDATTPGTLAHRFRKWVTAEVLPSLRKTGRYEATTAIPPSPVGHRRVLLVLRDNGTFEAKQVPDSAVMFAPEDLPNILADSTSGVFSRSLLPAIIGAAAERLAGLHPAARPHSINSTWPIEPPSIYDQVLMRVTAAKGQGLAVRDLISSCWAFRNLSSEDRTKLITQMIQDQAIVEIATTNKTGPKGKRLVAAKLVVRKG
jgi:prophage antirepressor-like protein